MVCVYVLPVSHASARSVHVRVRLHVRAYDVRIRICVLGFACVGPAMKHTLTYTHTNVAAHCATVARRHRYSGARDESARTYVCAYAFFLHLTNSFANAEWTMTK